MSRPNLEPQTPLVGSGLSNKELASQMIMQNRFNTEKQGLHTLTRNKVLLTTLAFESIRKDVVGSYYLCLITSIHLP
jgi:hypothetical protein